MEGDGNSDCEEGVINAPPYKSRKAGLCRKVVQFMALGLIGKKLGMTQIFDENGSLIPVTLVEAGPCPIIVKKDVDSDGYCALQLGFGKKPLKKTTKSEAKRFENAGIKPVRVIREFRLDNVSDYEVGQTLDVTVFEKGETVDVTGVSKGRGFAGTIKRFNTHRGPETHGSRYHRRIGSAGASSDPSRVYKGKKMPGHHGNKRSTVLNLKVVGMEKDKNILLIKGSIPGSSNGYVMIRKKKKKAAKSARR